MTDFFTVKNIMNIAAWKEIAETGINFFQFITGITKQVRPKHEGANTTKGHVRTDQAADGGKGIEDEFFYLIAPSSAWWNSLSAEVKTDQKFDASRVGRLNQIYEIFRQNGQPGAAEKLMHIIGRETHLYVPKTSRKRQGQRNKTGQQPGQPKEEEVTTEGMPERINPTGERFILFLTSMEPQQAVDMLNAAAVSKNTSDVIVGHAKKTEEELKRAAEVLKRWWLDGNRDTRIHTAWARVVLDDDKVLEQILSGEKALDLWNSYRLEEGHDPARARGYQEQLQNHIWEKVEAHQRRDQSPTDEPDQASTSRRSKWLPRKIPWMLFIWGGAAFFVLLTVFIHAIKSLGT